MSDEQKCVDKGAIPTWIVTDYGDLATAAGNAYGVAPAVILSVIYYESCGKIDVSDYKTGTHRGLMQIGESAFTEVLNNNGDRCLSTGKNLSDYSWASDILIPEVNIYTGAGYISVLTVQRETQYAALQQYSGYMVNYPECILASAELMQNGVTSAAGKPSGSSNAPAAKQASNSAKKILNFAAFAQTLAFKQSLMSSFEKSITNTLHSYLSEFMAKFYHELYYVPTLPDNKVILVKPECCFVDVPACNVIYPSIKESIGFSRNPKTEPTRIIMISNPVANIFGVAGSAITQLVTMVYMQEEKITDSKGTWYKQSTVSANNFTGNLNRPINNITAFEKRNGIRILREAKGEDLYLYLVSNNDAATDAKTKQKYYILTDATQANDICGTLSSLARYSLLRARYEPRSGSTTTLANPWIVPGLPMLSVEGETDSSMNIYGYVQAVTQQITDSSWTTNVMFNNTHIGLEPRPKSFPIAEQEYTETLEATYKNMLGTAMTKLTVNVEGIDTGAEECRQAYVESDKSPLAMMKRIWRPLTTREQHLEIICDGATVEQSEHYTWFKNADGKTFFNTDTQSLIMEYTGKLMAGDALTEADVR